MQSALFPQGLAFGEVVWGLNWSTVSISFRNTRLFPPIQGTPTCASSQRSSCFGSFPSLRCRHWPSPVTSRVTNPVSSRGARPGTKCRQRAPRFQPNGGFNPGAATSRPSLPATNTHDSGGSQFLRPTLACSNCDGEVSAAAKSCPHCGVSFESSSSSSGGTRIRGRSVVKLIGLGIVIVIAIGGFLLKLVNGNNQ